MVIFLGDRILGGKPQILLRIKRIAGSSSWQSSRWNLFSIVHALNNARALQNDGSALSDLGAVLSRKDKLCLSRSRNDHLGGLVHIAVGMTGHE